MCSCQKELNGLMNMSWQARPKTGFHITNSLPSNGWLAFAEVSGSYLTAKLEKTC